VPTYASDGICDDGGPGAKYPDCQYGTDCADCGVRPMRPPSPPSSPPPPPYAAAAPISSTVDVVLARYDEVLARFLPFHRRPQRLPWRTRAPYWRQQESHRLTSNLTLPCRLPPRLATHRICRGWLRRPSSRSPECAR
jgi:hypothetical protein